ncbi:MAG: phage tail protein [Rhodospirillales bacterium 20-64-7]|nr:MAG: phage tail protein [Rhodospirillales bacterium 20-64-7]HQT75784.1 tail fiber protein [Rhodopila sp.]
MADPFVGQIALFPYTFAPSGWADCAGQLLPISQNTALFSLLGTTFGGDGRMNFALPDLRGRVGIGPGSAPGGSTYAMGEIDGQETVALTAAQSASHTHSLNATTARGTVNTPGGNVLATALEGTPRDGNVGDIYNPGAPDTTLAPQSISVAGGSQPHNNVQPFLALRYCIALTGVYPPRS